MIIGHSNNIPPKPKFYLFKGAPPSVVPDMPAWDLPKSKTTIVDFAKDESTGGIRLAHTENNTPLGLWLDPNDYRNVMWHSSVQDFTKYSHIEFMLYSENPSGARFTFELRGKWLGNKEEPPYFRYEIILNWKGWRAYALDLTTLDAYWGGDMHDIHFVGLHATRWENEIYAIPGSYIYLSNVYLTHRKSHYQPKASAVTADVLDAIKDKWVDTLIGSKAHVEQHESARAYAERVGEHGVRMWKSMQKGQPTLWADAIDMRQGHFIQLLTERLFYMARAWASYGSPAYQNADILKDIHYGLEWVYQNAYGEEMVRLGKTGNWWQWHIGIPLALTKCLLLIRHTLTPEQITHFLYAADALDPYPFMTEANRIWISYVCILSSLLQDDVPRLIESVRRMQTVFKYVEHGDGFYEDGSFIQHTNSPYIGGYGTCYLENIVDIFYALDKTPLAICEAYRKMLMHHFTDAFAPFIYKGITQKSVSGRGVLGDSKAARQASAGLRLLPIAKKAEQKEIFSMIKAWCDANPPFAKELLTHLPPAIIPYYESMMAAKPMPIVAFARVFNGMDRTVTQSPLYCATLAFSTMRTARYESINEENKRGWYQGEGSLCVMTDDLYAYDGNYYRHANPYAFPGTTVTDVKRAEESVVFMPSGTYAFGGGVHDGTFAMAGTHIGFYAFNFPWHYGFSSDLDLKKSWFFFDEGILCLGSGITCTDNQMVYTTIDNRKCHKNYTLSVDGKTLTLRTSATTITSPTVIHHAVFGSYGFFGDTTVKCHKNTAGEGFYELRIEHGKHPENEGYAYLMLPCMDEAKATEYMQNPPVKILKNTPEQSVVCHQTAKVMGYTFFEAGEYEAVKVENPCILMTHETNKGLVCNVSDATHMFTTLTLHFAGAYRLAEHDDTVTATKTQEGITITINTNGTIGKVNTFVLTPDA